MSTIGSVSVKAGRRVAQATRALASALLPPVCCLCGSPGQRSDLDLCDVCATFLPVLDDRPAIDPRFESFYRGGTLVRTVFLFKYAYPVNFFIRALKFRGERVFARVMGELLARERSARCVEMPACIVPMPLHEARYRERGFNQALEIARFAGLSLGVKVEAGLLVRSLHTREQSGLTLDERRRNVRDAFKVVRPAPRGRVALLDDVVTTGSTAMAAAYALLDAGVGEVEIWAVAGVEKEMDF